MRPFSKQKFSWDVVQNMLTNTNKYTKPFVKQNAYRLTTQCKTPASMIKNNKMEVLHMNTTRFNTFPPLYNEHPAKTVI
jgi:hypothetical protein